MNSIGMNEDGFNKKSQGRIVFSGEGNGEDPAFHPVKSDKTGVEAINDCLRLAKLDCRVGPKNAG